MSVDKASHYIYISIWYRQPNGNSEDFQLLRYRLEQIRNKHIKKITPLGKFNFKDSDCPDKLNKSGTVLCQLEGTILIGIMNDHVLEQLVHFPTPEMNTLGLQRIQGEMHTNHYESFF